MKNISYLQKVLAVAVFLLLFSIGEADWWRNVTIVCYMYFGIFVANLFFKLYEAENTVTKVLFAISETPLYVGILVVVLSLIVQKTSPDVSVIGLYVCGIVGGLATTIARIKSGALPRR
jgi:hypothetical protein